MTIIQSAPQRSGSANVRRPVGAPGYGRTGYRAIDRTRRPGPTRPAPAGPRYQGTGVAMSTASHRKRPVNLLTTIGLALAAGAITLWLGMVANLGELMNGEAGSGPSVPAKLAVVRVESGESLQDLAARVAPGVPVRQEAERIRELNSLASPTLSAGQTLIAPVN